MPMNVTSAIEAYETAARSAREGKAAPAPEAGPEDFGSLIRASLKQAAAVQRTSEEMSLKGLAGEADMRDVVLAVNAAEHTLNTVIAVRDKVLQAYQEILKMPI